MRILTDLTSAITGASYDTNGDAWVEGMKYRRISKEDTNYLANYCLLFCTTESSVAKFIIQPLPESTALPCNSFAWLIVALISQSSVRQNK